MKKIIIKLICIAIPVLFLSTALASEFSDKEKTLSVSKGGNLSVSLFSGNISIKTWDKNELHIKLEGENLNYIKISQEGNSVSIRTNENEEKYRDKSFTLFVSIPKEFNIELKTNGGNISLENSLKGNVKVNTAGGNIVVPDIDGNTSLKTSGGNISTGSIKGDIDVTTSGGDIKCGNISGSAAISTAGGNIRIGNVNNSISAKTSGGNISFASITGKAELKTAGGNISGDSYSNGTIELKTSGGNIKLKSGNGKIEAKTAAGNIELRNIKGSVEAKTSAGQIDVELTPATNTESELSTAAGDIRLYIPENANTKIDATVNMQGVWVDESDYTDAISSDFKAASFEKKKNKQQVNATYILNNGGSTISVKALMGKILIKKAK